MRIYSISVMVISSIVLAIVLLCFMVDVFKFTSPELAIEGQDYKKFISLEFFRQQEMKHSIDSKYGPDLTKLSDSDWNLRWEKFKEVTIMEEKHAAKIDMMEGTVTFVVFAIFFVLHFVLYRRYSKD